MGKSTKERKKNIRKCVEGKRGRERGREMGKKSEKSKKGRRSMGDKHKARKRKKKNKRFNRIRRMKGLFYEGTGERSGKKVRRDREREREC